MKNLKLVEPENYTFTADNNFFIASGVPEKFLKKLTENTRLFFLAYTKHPLLQRLPQNHYHYTGNKSTKLTTS